MKIPLSQGKFAVVDECDRKIVEQYKKWQFHASSTKRTGYAVTYVPLLNWRTSKDGKRQFRVFLHDLIMRPKTGLEVDHIDGDGLNNRRKNMRLCTRTQQCQNRGVQKNTTGYKGVSKKHYRLCGDRWHAQIRHDGRQLHLGTFDTKEAAALAYNNAAKKFFGEYARLNVLPRGTKILQTDLRKRASALRKRNADGTFTARKQ